MRLEKNTVLITGGASGIGLALAERFHKAGNKVVICGRRPERLEEAKQKLPGIHTKVCDLAKESDRVALRDWAVREFPELNVLVNNAGIQRRNTFFEERWEDTRQEIVINLESPIHLCRLFLPHLLKQETAAILNVTSGLAFVPLAMVPVYSATKAAFHSFTLSLRHHLSKTPVQVIEVAPPAVDTDLGGPGLHKEGVPLDQFADAAFEGLRRGDPEVTFGFSEKTSKGSRQELDQIFSRMNPAPAGAPAVATLR